MHDQLDRAERDRPDQVVDLQQEGLVVLGQPGESQHGPGHVGAHGATSSTSTSISGAGAKNAFGFRRSTWTSSPSPAPWRSSLGTWATKVSPPGSRSDTR